MTYGIRSAPREPRDEPKVGTHRARLVGLIDLGMQPPYEYQGKTVKAAYQSRFIYELGKSLMEDGRPHWVDEDIKESDYFESRTKASNMMRRVYAMDPTGQISDHGKNLRALLGKACMVEVDHNKNGYLTVVNVIGGDEDDTPALQNDIVFSSFEEPNIEVYQRLPEFVHKKIKGALTFKGSNLEKALLAEGLIGNEDGKY